MSLQPVKHLGIIGGAIGTVLCLIGTAVGLIELIHASSALGYILSVGMSVMIVILLLGTKSILKRRGPFRTMLYPTWWIAVALVAVSLWVFTHKIYLRDAIAGSSLFNAIVETLVACAAILILAGAPAYLSHLIPIRMDSTDSEPEE